MDYIEDREETQSYKNLEQNIKQINEKNLIPDVHILELRV